MITVQKNAASVFTRLGQLGWFYVRSAFASPQRFVGLLRRPVGAALDAEFEAVSPLPVLPVPLRNALGREWALLPPRGGFAGGNQDPTGLLYLVTIARALNARTIFEIGTYNGLTALTLARNLPTAEVLTLDLPSRVQPAMPILESDVQHINGGATRAYEGQPEAERIVQLLGDSAAFDFGPWYGTCQLVYVDGAHSFQYVENDSRHAFGLVSECGAIVWDDYWRPVPDVARYLNPLGKSNIFRLPESRLVVWLTDQAMDQLLARGT